jgi:hypothetical protein
MVPSQENTSVIDRYSERAPGLTMVPGAAATISPGASNFASDGACGQYVSEEAYLPHGSSSPQI